MKITIFLIALLWLCSPRTYAQTPYAIKGSVADTTEKVGLVNATVMVLNAKDSILQKHTRVRADGTFSVTNLNPGKYILVLSYPKYADYTDAFTLDATKKENDFGKIGMVLKSRLLMDVIIKGQVTAIKIKGDTTEFNAKAYVIQPNDKVEDLIKQFPGIQVDKDGKITAQGQAISKVLVDGEEFFGDDPTLVTKNLRADMVDKVQLYDKKSDQAAFTGIDDGTKIKTLNIKLKENKKKGYFGKVDAGVGTNDFYSGQGLFNYFNGKQKFSTYTTLSNTGKTGLSWQDNQKYGDGGGGGGADELDSFNGRYDNQGIPKAATGGLHYDNKWNSDKKSINTNYKAGSLEVDGMRNAQSINNLTDGLTNKQTLINRNSDQTFNNYLFRQKFDMTYQVAFDTTTNLKLYVDATLRNNRTYNKSNAFTTRNGDTLVNRSNGLTDNKGTQNAFNANMFFTKKLHKTGRTYSIYLGGSSSENDIKGFLLSQLDYYNLGSRTHTDSVDQYKTSFSKNRTFNSNITYTEPLFKGTFVTLNYGVNINNSSSDRKSFNQSAPGNYTVLVDSLSNNFKIDQLAQQMGVGFNYKKGKSLLNFGLRASDVSFKQLYINVDTVFKRHFINWNPQLNYQFKISQQSGFYFNYNGNTSQPSIGQIQPIRDNANPLNITVGNDQLKPSFSNNFSMSYNAFKVLSSQSIYISGNFSFTSNQIINNTTLNVTSGTSVTRYVNLEDKTPFNYGIYGYFDRKIPGIDANVGMNINFNGYKNYRYANNVLNQGNSNTYSGAVTFNKYAQKKYSIYVGGGPVYTASKSTPLNGAPIIINNSAGFFGNGYFQVFLPGKFQVGTDITYTYTGATANFDNTLKRTIWNASLAKTFLKDDNLKLSVSGNDLLDQNTGFSRNADGNAFSQSTYTTIRRYFMISVTWDFNKMGGMPAKN